MLAELQAKRAKSNRDTAVARALAKARPVSVKTTLLGAHALPPEFKGDADVASRERENFIRFVSSIRWNEPARP